jgi:hypothetical protein
MWVHYAKHLTDFVLGFNSAARFFADNARPLDRVIYQNARML